MKNFIALIGSILCVLSINAQTCDITPNRYKGCCGDIFEFTIMAAPSSYSSIKWEFGDGSSSNQLTSVITHKYDTFGVFTVRVTLKDNKGKTICGPNSITIYIYDQPNAIIGLLSPSKQLLKGNEFEFIDNSQPGKSNASINLRSWDFGDGTYDSINNTIPNPVYSYHQSGTYLTYIQIADTNGCVDTASVNVTITDSTTSLIESAKSMELFVYPNPFKESLHVFNPGNVPIREIDLLDISGKSILIRRNIKGSNIEIFRDGLPRGMYILKIVSDKVYQYKILAE
jgi:hypothetical protein